MRNSRVFLLELVDNAPPFSSKMEINGKLGSLFTGISGLGSFPSGICGQRSPFSRVRNAAWARFLAFNYMSPEEAYMVR